MRIEISSLRPLNLALIRILAKDAKDLQRMTRGFQPKRRPLERPEESMAQNSQPSLSLEKI